MCQCPFWSTANHKVNCFKDCAFYSEKISEECPFKLYEDKHSFNIKDIFEYDDVDGEYEDLVW